MHADKTLAHKSAYHGKLLEITTNAANRLAAAPYPSIAAVALLHALYAAFRRGFLCFFFAAAIRHSDLSAVELLQDKIRQMQIVIRQVVGRVAKQTSPASMLMGKPSEKGSAAARCG